jgi:hypothetical protein
MKQTAVEWLVSELKKYDSAGLKDQSNYVIEMPTHILTELEEQAKEIEEKNLLEMLHKFGFDYTYNYKGEKTIYEWIPEWFEEYKRLLTI